MLSRDIEVVMDGERFVLIPDWEVVSHTLTHPYNGLVETARGCQIARVRLNRTCRISSVEPWRCP